MSKKRARSIDEDNHWLLLTLPDERQLKCTDAEVVIGWHVLPGFCERHLVLSHGHDWASAVLTCPHELGSAKVDELCLVRGAEPEHVVGGKTRLHCGATGEVHARVNVSVLLGLPRNEYEWLDVLGIGSQAEVKRVQDKASGETFAAKVYHKTKVMGHTKTVAQALAQDGRKEAEMLRSLRHPHIVSLHRIIESERHLILVLDLVNSGDLCDVINRGRLPHEQIRSIFRQMAEAVAFLHRHNVAHCDIKVSQGNCALHKE
jgi:hypothetical protein